MITIKPSIETDLSTVETFFGTHWPRQTYKNDLFNFGRFIEINGEKLGFFALIPCDEKEGWLRSLYFKENFNPAMIVLGIDWIKQAALQEGYQRIYAFSHSTSTDAIFQTWGFTQQDEQPDNIVDNVDNQGKWWSLKLNLSTYVDKPC